MSRPLSLHGSFGELDCDAVAASDLSELFSLSVLMFSGILGFTLPASLLLGLPALGGGIVDSECPQTLSVRKLTVGAKIADWNA